MEECRTIEPLLSAWLDRELTQQDRQRVEVHVDSCAACGEILHDLERLREGIGRIDAVEPSPDQWRKAMGVTIGKTSRGLGWLFGAAGIGLLLGFGVYEFVIDASTPTLDKIAVGALVGGVLLLLFSVWLDRMRARKSDPYKDVEK